VTDPAIVERLPEEGRGHILRCDLRAKGITDYGQLAVRGFGQPPSPPTLELFVNGQPMTLARLPNKGFVGICKLVQPGSKAEGKPSVFEYIDDRAARWTKAKDAWLLGYFRFLWADATVRITKVDPAAHTITVAEAYQYGPPGMDNGQGIQYYAFNLLDEIDRPGEWYLDRTASVLYLYPPGDLANTTVEIGLLSTPMVTMDRVTDVRLEGLTFDLARYNGLVLTDCSRCLVTGCTISHARPDVEHAEERRRVLRIAPQPNHFPRWRKHRREIVPVSHDGNSEAQSPNSTLPHTPNPPAPQRPERAGQCLDCAKAPAPLGGPLYGLDVWGEPAGWAKAVVTGASCWLMAAATAGCPEPGPAFPLPLPLPFLSCRSAACWCRFHAPSALVAKARKISTVLPTGAGRYGARLCACPTTFVPAR